MGNGLPRRDLTLTADHALFIDGHEIILAEEAATKTFIDNVSRQVFDNFAEFDALYGDAPEMTEMPYLVQCLRVRCRLG